MSFRSRFLEPKYYTRRQLWMRMLVYATPIFFAASFFVDWQILVAAGAVFVALHWFAVRRLFKRRGIRLDTSESATTGSD